MPRFRQRLFSDSHRIRDACLSTSGE